MSGWRDSENLQLVDYIAPDTLKNFERDTGVASSYDVYDSNETLTAS